MSEIKCIDQATVHQICSGQVIFDLSIAIKELVENSIDAGATSVEVKLKEYGLEQVEVIDNGSGVEERSFCSLTLKHHTSKLQDFSDLSRIETFGFRGEALSSLCGLCDVTICTRHAKSNVGHKIEYDQNGIMTSQTCLARQIGTTVTLKNIFHSIPVRYKEFKKNIKKEYSKVLTLLSAYCIISTGIKLTCSNQIGKEKKRALLSTHGTSSIQENIVSVYGTKQLQTLKKFKKAQPSKETCEYYRLKVEEAHQISLLYSISGMLSDVVHGHGRSAPDRQFYFVNSRPMEVPRLSKLVNEVYHSYNRHQYPFVVLNIEMRRDNVDINVTPDKRQVFLHNEKVLLSIVKSSLIEMYEGSHIVLPVTQSTLTSKFISISSKQSTMDNNDAFDEDGTTSSNQPSTNVLDCEKNLSFKNIQTDVNFEMHSVKNSSINRNIGNHMMHKSVLPSVKKACLQEFANAKVLNSANISMRDVKKRSLSQVSSRGNLAKQPRVESCASSNLVPNKTERDSSKSPSEIELENDTNNILKCNADLEDSYINKSSPMGLSETSSSPYGLPTSTDKNLDRLHEEDSYYVLDSPETDSVEITCEEITFSLQRVKTLLSIKRDISEKNCLNSLSFRAKIRAGQNSEAEKELSRNLDKNSFKEMIPLGQFNLGFIIAKFGNDLFIIDQHASDEIYNFETLQKTTEMHGQNLVTPQKLDLSPADQLVLSENILIFQKNGFEFIVKRDQDTDEETHYLTKVPWSKNWEFGSRDVEELIFMLSDAPNVMCRPSRIRSMFASRACRKSVMIGTALDNREMSRLIKHMSEITHPWNCPHGRPTMRHLIDLSKIS